MTLASERHAVQNPLIRYAEEAGWDYLPPKEALRLRGGEDQPFLRSVLVGQLQRLNPGVVTNIAKAEEVIGGLTRVRPTETYEIGSAALRALLHEDKPDTVKVFNLLKELYRLVEAQGKQAPHLIPIGERAEEIRRRFEERQISAQEALRDLDALVRQLEEAERERSSSALSPEAFAVEWWLRTREVSPDLAMRAAEEMEAAFRECPHWMTSQAHERELRERLYKALIAMNAPNVVDWATQILALLRRAAE
ncbi:MAG: hypothetical protein H5T66_00230 [Chloroflexi bacterium]|nr:hypothetical protein [Chloroflexota bacterium]